MKRKFKVKDIYTTKSYTEKDILNGLYGIMNDKEDIMNAKELLNDKELLNALNTTIPKLKEKEPNLEIKTVEYHRDVIANVAYPSGEEKELILARKVVSFDATTLEALKVELVKGANDEEV